MNYNQNEKIAQITSQTLIIGVDIAKYKHVARAQDFRGQKFCSGRLSILKIRIRISIIF